jgi:hypothetical protein
MLKKNNSASKLRVYITTHQSTNENKSMPPRAILGEKKYI